MNKEFIPYEQALELEKLGFNETCFGRWLIIKEMEASTGEVKLQIGVIKEDYDKDQFYAPLYQQAFRWFREKYNYCYFIRGNNYDGYYYDIDNLGMLRYKIEIDNRLTWKTYEEAELECLKKLIEIIKP